jgi:4-hydroxythreonine-4-phosphate dehydrogenase
VRRPRLAITLGDPRGVGPEIVGKALEHLEVRQACDTVIVGPRGASIEVDEAIGSWTAPRDEAAAGRLAGLAIERAATLARERSVDGIVTAPIDKHALLRGGYSDPGHTEMLARLMSSRTAMMLTSDRLRVVLATTHIPLRDVPTALSREVILHVARLTSAALRSWFDIETPRIALCALNPHAGDGGRFGHEDDALLAPVAREAGLEGPLPADTVFVRAIRGEFDAVIAPYHDVGMTAIKVASFGQAVNVTLGLPFPRTSPDHGTALDIAGKGIASPASMVRAILMCARLAGMQQKR